MSTRGDGAAHRGGEDPAAADEEDDMAEHDSTSEQVQEAVEEKVEQVRRMLANPRRTRR